MYRNTYREIRVGEIRIIEKIGHSYESSKNRLTDVRVVEIPPLSFDLTLLIYDAEIKFQKKKKNTTKRIITPIE